MRVTKQQRLQTAWDATPYIMPAVIEFVPFNGWWVRPDEARHIGDEGDWIGHNYAEAATYIDWLNVKPTRRVG